MKKISLLLAFVAFFGLGAFANTADKAVKQNRTPQPAISIDRELEESVQSFLKKASCTVKETWTNADGTSGTATVTVSCDGCTTQQACNAAHAAIALVVPG